MYTRFIQWGVKLYQLKDDHRLTSSDCNIHMHVYTGRGSSDSWLYFWEGSIEGGDGCCRESEEADRSLHITTYHTIHINNQTTLEIHLAEEIVLECWVWKLLKVKEVLCLKWEMAHWTPSTLESVHESLMAYTTQRIYKFWPSLRQFWCIHLGSKEITCTWCPVISKAVHYIHFSSRESRCTWCPASLVK